MGGWKKIIALAALAGLTSACATVTSTPSRPNELRSGLTYYLPRREVKVTAERKLLKKADLDKLIAAAKAKLTAAEETAATADTGVKAEEKLLLQLARDTKAWNDSEARRATFFGQKTIADAAVLAAQGELAKAEAQLALLNAGNGGDCIFSYSGKLELLAPVADLRHRFVADLDHSPFRDDELKLAVNGAGLLTSANVIAADRTGDILVEIAGAISSFGSAGGFQMTNFQTEASRCGELPGKFVYQFDPVNGVDAANRELTTAGYPFRVQIVFQGGCEGSCLSDAGRRVTDPVRTGRQRNRQFDLAEASRHRGRYGAIFYPSPIPATVILRQCASGTECGVAEAQPVDAALAMVPQAGPVSFIPMQSSAFVRTVDDVTFDNGVIASWNATRPSEVLEIVRLPVRILKAVLEAPAQIISLRVNLSDKDKALAASQQAQIEAQTKLAELRSCIEVAEREKRSAASCFAAK
jgi:hypothetical protein